MTTIAYSIVGSGTIPFARAILPSSQRGYEPNGRGERGGIQTQIANPEDLVAVDAFAASGVSVSTTSVEVVGFGNNPLPRCRNVIVKNGGATAVLLSHKQNFTDIEGFPLSALGTANDQIELSIMKNVSVWARTASGSTTVKVLIF